MSTTTEGYTNNTTTTTTVTNDVTDTKSVAISTSFVELELAPLRYQCCECELWDAVFVTFGEDEICSRCGHWTCRWCVPYKRLTEQVLGA
jgi:hypothetical protein